ncbi:hypothetical protein GCM10018773_11530 [Streptomyces candidus]|nr:hypothetical protein GCM10018773_11530 [Streptomyces candidus]
MGEGRAVPPLKGLRLWGPGCAAPPPKWAGLRGWGRVGGSDGHRGSRGTRTRTSAPRTSPYNAKGVAHGGVPGATPLQGGRRGANEAAVAAMSCRTHLLSGKKEGPVNLDHRTGSHATAGLVRVRVDGHPSFGPPARTAASP